MIRIYLSKLLGIRKMTRYELSKRTGIRTTTISEYYHELIERITIDHLDKICEALNCKLSDLMEYIPKEKIKDKNIKK
jgi:putative transcriptional regulator